MDSVVRSPVLKRPRLSQSGSGAIGLTINGIAVAILLVFLFTVGADTPAMRLGQVAGETVVAQKQVTFSDKAATAARRRHAMAMVPPAYRFTSANASARTQLAKRFLNQIGVILAGQSTNRQKQSAILRLLPAGLSSAAIAEFPILSSDDFRAVQTDSISLMEGAEAWRFAAGDMQATELGLLSTVAPHLSRDGRIAVSDILVTFLTPTLTVNAARTKALREAAARRVGSVWVTVYRGEVIVRRGDIVTSDILEKLSALGVTGHHIGWNDLAASLLFAGVILAALFWYMLAFHETIVTQPRLLLLIDCALLVAVLGARLLTTGHVLLPYFLPVAAISTFAAVLIAPEACIALALAMALLAGWIVANSFELTTYYFLSGAAGVLAIQQVRQLKQFIMAGVYISLFALAAAMAFALSQHNYDFAALREYVFASGANGFLSSTLALGGFALLSSFFGVTTSLQLLELGQPNQPLLRRLMVKAPGTYNHSLILASMVEHAAQEIGADALVAKVGALYHDVGKTANPHCFVENQLGMGNIHDELRPDESARIIRGHVSGGLRLAKQHKLPRTILDAIAEHHGTMQLAFFLHKAREEANGKLIDRSLYSYPGPKPQTKETALIMLADGCESAVRASHDHSTSKIRDIIATIFRERGQQGQLDECPLTLRDLHDAGEAYASILSSLYHPRVEYPEALDAVIDVTPLIGTRADGVTVLSPRPQVPEPGDGRQVSGA